MMLQMHFCRQQIARTAKPKFLIPDGDMVSWIDLLGMYLQFNGMGVRICCVTGPFTKSLKWKHTSIYLTRTYGLYMETRYLNLCTMTRKNKYSCCTLVGHLWSACFLMQQFQKSVYENDVPLETVADNHQWKKYNQNSWPSYNSKSFNWFLFQMAFAFNTAVTRPMQR